jgi:hypothetical protein
LKPWKQIGRELGISPGYAWQIGNRAMKKLTRKQPEMLAVLKKLADELDAARVGN